MRPLGLRGARPVRFALGPIQNLCLEKDWTPLTSIVINKNTKLPGTGFIAGSGKPKEDQDSVFAFPWTSLPIPFPASTRDKRQTVFSKRGAKPDPAEFEVDDHEVFVNGRGPFQGRFRKMLWRAYGGRCCLCDSQLSEILVASHIVPWSVDRRNRLNPCNGLLLCRTHDCLFESGIIRISPSLDVQIVETRPNVLGKDLARVVTHHTRRRIRLPRRRHAPSREFLEWRINSKSLRSSASRVYRVPV